jgi:hypothetical protein
MKIVNRGYIRITPTEKFWEWARIQDEEIDASIDFNEPNVYLIEDEFWDDTLLIEKYYKKLSTFECYQVSEDDHKILEPESAQDFLTYFNVEIGSTVIDCLKTSIDKD